MTDSKHTRFFWLIEQIPQIASAVAIIVGIFVLFGWWFDLPQLKSVFSGLSAIKINAALGLILAGISLCNASLRAPSSLSQSISRICAASVLLLGLLTMGEYLSGKNFGIDELVMQDITNLPGDIPGRMGVITAVSFTILGIALIFLSRKKGGLMGSIHVLAIALILIAGSTLVSYGYNIEKFLRAKLNYNPMAIHTAAGFVLLSFGILNARPDYPLRRIMISDSAAASTARKLWCAAMALQLVMGWLLLKAVQAGYFSDTVALAFFVVANIGGLTALIYWNTAQLYKAEKAFQGSEKRYRTLLNSLQEGICAIDTDICITFVNPRMAEMLGCSIDEMLGKPLLPFLDEHAQQVLLYNIERPHQGIKEQYELELRRKDGSRIYTSIVGAPIYDEQGNYTGSLAGIADITAYKRAEQALRESEEKYRTLFESIDEGFGTVEVLFDENEKPLDCRLLIVNPAFERQTGISNAAGRRMQEIAPLHKERCLEIYAKIALTGEPIRFEDVSEDLHHYYDVYAFRIGAQAERKVAILFNDITERKQAEEQLRTASRYTRSLIEASLDPLATISADGKITDVNRATEEVTGLKREQLIGSDFSEYFTEPEQARKGYQMVFAQGFVKDYPLAIRHISGRITEVLYNATLYRNEKGEVAGVVAVARDISELKRNETALRESEEKFRTISNFAQDAILMMDNDGAISYWNPAAETIFGYSAELILGKPLHQLLAPEHYFEDFRRGFAHFRTTGEGPAVGKTQELMAKRNTGEEFPIELSLSAIKLGERWNAVGIIRDITERKRAVEQLRHARDQLELRVEKRTLELAAANQALQEDIKARIYAEEQLRKLNETLAQQISVEVAKNREKDMLMIQQSRMAAMGEMIGNIAHQWRQPLSALAILLGVIKEAHELGELNDEYLEQAIANGQRLIKKMSTTINDFRDFFRPDKEKTTFSALAQINEAISIVEASFKNNNISLKLIAAYDLNLQGFPNEYSQVLLNLLSNAKDAIQTRNIAEGKIVIRLERESNFGRVSVTDNGGGIPTAILDKIFDPYFSTKTRGGTGIGLYMSKMIIERNMNGRLSARNTNGGAEFVIETPLASEVLSSKATEGESS